MRGARRGFTLVEVVVSIAIFIVAMLAALAATHAVVTWNQRLNVRDAEHSQLGAAMNRWQAEAASAWSIFTPATDLFGKPNGDGHELDFFTKDGVGRAHFWAYDYDASALHLQRYRYLPGGTNVADGTPIEGVTAFTAQTLPASDLARPGSAIYDALFANAAIRDERVALGYGNAVLGGNQLTRVHVAGAGVDSTLLLATATAPSGFTIVLRYTPRPGASLSVVPARIAFARVGIAYVPPAMQLAQIVNRALGGGVADARTRALAYNPFPHPSPRPPSPTPSIVPTATPTAAPTATPTATLPPPLPTPPPGSCNGAYAYSANGAPDANDARIGTDANGCYTGTPNVYASEPGYSGAFSVNKGTCGSYLSWGKWSGNGPIANKGIGSAAATPGCTFYVTSADHPTPATGALPVQASVAAVTCGSEAQDVAQYYGMKANRPYSYTPFSGNSGGGQFSVPGGTTVTFWSVLQTYNRQTNDISQSGTWDTTNTGVSCAVTWKYDQIIGTGEFS